MLHSILSLALTHSRGQFNRWLFIILLIVGAVLLAHGCHADADHEL